MFSFIKTLDICEDSISFTFHGNIKSIKNVKTVLQKKFINRATFVYRVNSDESGSVVICKNQTCSNKISDISEIEKYLLKNNIN